MKSNLKKLYLLNPSKPEHQKMMDVFRTKKVEYRKGDMEKRSAEERL